MGEVEVRVNNALSIFEKGLNIAGYVPYVATYSAGIRATYGVYQITGGIACAALVGVASLFARDPRMSQKGFDRAWKILSTYTMHGFSNIFRAAVEATPFFIRWPALLPYDQILGMRHKYPTERPGRWVFVNSSGV